MTGLAKTYYEIFATFPSKIRWETIVLQYWLSNFESPIQDVICISCIPGNRSSNRATFRARSSSSCLVFFHTRCIWDKTVKKSMIWKPNVLFYWQRTLQRKLQSPPLSIVKTLYLSSLSRPYGRASCPQRRQPPWGRQSGGKADMRHLIPTFPCLCFSLSSPQNVVWPQETVATAPGDA